MSQRRWFTRTLEGLAHYQRGRALLAQALFTSLGGGLESPAPIGQLAPPDLLERLPAAYKAAATAEDVDLDDIAVFTAVLLGNDTITCHVLRSDVNNDGNADGKDVAGFLDAILSQ